MPARSIPFSSRRRRAIAPGARHDTPVARVLIIEPHDEVRDLLARVVRRLGHEVIFPGAEPGLVDAVIVEPAAAPPPAPARPPPAGSPAAGGGARPAGPGTNAPSRGAVPSPRFNGLTLVDQHRLV